MFCNGAELTKEDKKKKGNKKQGIQYILQQTVGWQDSATMHKYSLSS
jgi:hypothetical protein